jgi:hypothetical protein
MDNENSFELMKGNPIIVKRDKDHKKHNKLAFYAKEYVYDWKSWIFCQIKTLNVTNFILLLTIIILNVNIKETLDKQISENDKSQENISIVNTLLDKSKQLIDQIDINSNFISNTWDKIQNLSKKVNATGTLYNLQQLNSLNSYFSFLNQSVIGSVDQFESLSTSIDFINKNFMNKTFKMFTFNSITQNYVSNFDSSLQSLTKMSNPGSWQFIIYSNIINQNTVISCFSQVESSSFKIILKPNILIINSLSFSGYCLQFPTDVNCASWNCYYGLCALQYSFTCLVI